DGGQQRAQFSYPSRSGTRPFTRGSRRALSLRANSRPSGWLTIRAKWPPGFSRDGERCDARPKGAASTTPPLPSKTTNSTLKVAFRSIPSAGTFNQFWSAGPAPKFSALTTTSASPQKRLRNFLAKLKVVRYCERGVGGAFHE